MTNQLDTKLDALIDAIIDLEDEYAFGLPDAFTAAINRARTEKTRLLAEEYPLI